MISSRSSALPLPTIAPCHVSTKLEEKQQRSGYVKRRTQGLLINKHFWSRIWGTSLAGATWSTSLRGWSAWIIVAMPHICFMQRSVNIAWYAEAACHCVVHFWWICHNWCFSSWLLPLPLLHSFRLLLNMVPMHPASLKQCQLALTPRLSISYRTSKKTGTFSGMRFRTLVDTLGIKSKSGSNGHLKVKASVQAPSKVNGTKAGVMEGLRSEIETQSHAPGLLSTHFRILSFLAALPFILL